MTINGSYIRDFLRQFRRYYFKQVKSNNINFLKLLLFNLLFLLFFLFSFFFSSFCAELCYYNYYYTASSGKWKIIVINFSYRYVQINNYKHPKGKIRWMVLQVPNECKEADLSLTTVNIVSQICYWNCCNQQFLL